MITGSSSHERFSKDIFKQDKTNKTIYSLEEGC